MYLRWKSIDLFHERGYPSVPSRNGLTPMSTPTKRQLTVQLSDLEMEALESLADKRALTKVAVLRQALRLYQTVDNRQQRGEKLFFENELSKEKAELMLL